MGKNQWQARGRKKYYKKYYERIRKLHGGENKFSLLCGFVFVGNIADYLLLCYTSTQWPDEVPLFICMMSEGGSEWKNFGGQERKVTERTKER